MLITLFGISGVGKSFFCNEISKNFDIKKVQTLRTRERRNREKNVKNNSFVNEQQLEDMRQKGEIAYEFALFGNTYAFKKEELFYDGNSIMEMNYLHIDVLKILCPNIITIYILPKDIEKSIKRIKKRKLKIEEETIRIAEAYEEYNSILKDADLRGKFDYTIYNSYNLESKSNIIKLILNCLS